MTVIRRLLIANRGEIAERIMRTCREMGIATVAVHSDADTSAGFVRRADRAVLLGGAAPSDSYLNVERIIDAARRTGADAVHPGYGFLSEQGDFARAALDAGLIWVGPDPDSIDAMGSKLRAKELMLAAGVPLLPSMEVDPSDTTAVVAAGAAVGYPLLVKASAGGGGKGMRVVDHPDDLAEAVTGAAREAAAAFGDPTIFAERYLRGPRHIEVQVFGDTHGTVVPLFERECSIQRRHQKVIEESPSPAVDADLRRRLCDAAVQAARTVAYVGAGTVEFLVDDTGEFWFLEMNTRLQVEHPVTEAITGLDLVRLQLEVAEGRPLPESIHTVAVSGHAIEARLYAEDPTRDFLPQAGRLVTFEMPDTVRVDTGVTSGSEISPHYDPMIAKVISWAPTRSEATRALGDALARARLHGIVTNRDLLVGVLESDEFVAGHTDTDFLERHDPATLGAQRVTDPSLHALAAALAGQAGRRADAPILASLPSGWRNSPSQPQRVTYLIGERTLAIGYRFTRDGLEAWVDDTPLTVDAVEVTPESVTLTVDGIRSTWRVVADGDRRHVDGADGSVSLVELPRLPVPVSEEESDSLRAPMPGKVIQVLVAPGDAVTRGTPLVVIEAMKMEHSVRSPDDGTVTDVRVAPGEQVEGDAVLVVIDN